MAFEASLGTLSKKLSNGRHSGIAGASVYDGVFASPPKNKVGASVAANLSSRAEDYHEIFGGASGASSIPFLDVPELSEQKVSVDVRSSKLDYSKIFAGDGDSSFAAVRFEELYQQPNTRKKSEKEWPPVERLSPSEASERSAFSDENNVPSSQASHLAFSGVKKFNMSYNKINNGNLTGTRGTNGTTHIAQLNAVRGYVHLVDEATPMYRTRSDKPVVSSVNDGGPKCNNFVRSSEDVLVGETVMRSAGVNVESQSSPNWFKLNSMGKPSDKYEVGSGNPHSKVPSSSTLPRNFNFGYGGDRTNDNGDSASNSPPYFEEEVDANSVAATSAAALRKAIEEAQAKIKVAKEIMERKKAGVRNKGKSFSEKLKPEEIKDGNVSSGVSKSTKKKTRELCEEVEMPLHASSETRQHTTGPANVAANFEVRERVLSSENGETSRKETSSLADHRRKVEVPEAEQFYDVENTSEISSPMIEVDVTQVSTMSSTHNVTGPVQLPEYSEVQKFVSGARGTARGTVCNDIKSSREDHRRQEKSEPAQVAEQFYEFEDVTRMQAVDENIGKEKEKENIIAEEVFEKPQQGREGLKPAEKENNPKEVVKGIEIQNGTNRASGRSKDVGEARLEVKAFDQEKIKQKQRFSPKIKESGDIVLRFDENDKCERSPREFLEILNYGKLHDSGRLEDAKYMKRDLTTWECVESEREVEEENEREQSHAHGLEDNEKKFINKTIKGERMKEKLNGFHLGKKIAQILSHVVEPEGIEKIHERDVSQKKENEIMEEESCQRVDVVRTSTKVAVEELRNLGSNLGVADNGKSENQIPVIFADDDETLKVSEEAPSCKDSGSSITEPSKCLMEANDSVEEKYDVEKTHVLKANGIHQDLELYNTMKPLEDETESSFVDENDLSDEIRMGMKSVRKRWDKPVSLFDIVHDLRPQVKELSPEFENVEYVKKFEVDADLVYDEDKTECFGEQGRFASGITMQEAELSDISEEGESVGICGETERSTSKEKDNENCEEIPISHNGEMNEESRPILSEDKNDRVAVHVDQSTANESLEKEKELERKQRRKVDDAKEWEREIAKGRIAVERAVREARERAFAEARERAAAEKAGASQRVKAEAREKARKTSGEPNSKSVADKAREAKLKAERAAVERATSEARVRALEKAMSSKTASARKQNPQQHKGPSFTSTSRYPYSSNDGGSVSNSTERYDGANDESAQRCKARSERHQRISERAEKALAEKNRRDLLAQKEQAEKNRLAETLDIEVKRWSSGKEGNLRALLSTLQYILGSESGWQPIPLTEIITTTAVKKAYRKATLFVHPDKLQQRGANIQQKYTCEKVFDLLKEAWNKFNVEER